MKRKQKRSKKGLRRDYKAALYRQGAVKPEAESQTETVHAAYDAVHGIRLIDANGRRI